MTVGNYILAPVEWLFRPHFTDRIVALVRDDTPLISPFNPMRSLTASVIVYSPLVQSAYQYFGVFDYLPYFITNLNNRFGVDWNCGLVSGNRFYCSHVYSVFAFTFPDVIIYPFIFVSSKILQIYQEELFKSW